MPVPSSRGRLPAVAAPPNRDSSASAAAGGLGAEAAREPAPTSGSAAAELPATPQAARSDQTARSDHRSLTRRPKPWDRVSLLWRVFAVNVVVFVVAVVLLAWTPVTVHRVATPGELVI